MRFEKSPRGSIKYVREALFENENGIYIYILYIDII